MQVGVISARHTRKCPKCYTKIVYWMQCPTTCGGCMSHQITYGGCMSNQVAYGGCMSHQVA